MNRRVVIRDLFAVFAGVVVENQHPLGIKCITPRCAHQGDGETDEQAVAQSTTAYASHSHPGLVDRPPKPPRNKNVIPAACQMAVWAAESLLPSSKLLVIPSANQKCTHHAEG